MPAVAAGVVAAGTEEPAGTNVVRSAVVAGVDEPVGTIVDEPAVAASKIAADTCDCPAATDVGRAAGNRVEMPAVAAGGLAAGTERTAIGRNGGVFHP
jgi:hypothetical protein